MGQRACSKFRYGYQTLSPGREKQEKGAKLIATNDSSVPLKVLPGSLST
ncbi:hypothetical protein Plhal304r1_c018g0065631 [Plasmopara halstedii]